MNTATTITTRVAQLHAAQAELPPNELMGAFTREQAALAAAAPPPGRFASVGTVLPDTELLDPQGAPTTLYAAIGRSASVLVFYRGAWCPYCNIALATYQAALVPALAERGINLVAVSPQTPDGSLSMAQKNDLTFSVVSDPGNRIAGSTCTPTTAPAPNRSRSWRAGPPRPLISPADSAESGPTNEEDTIAWYAFKVSDTTYGIFDTFETEDGRQAHLAHLGGQIPTAFGQVAPDLLATDPDIRIVDIIAVK